MNQMCKEDLMRFIYQVDFAVDDIVLYLDTHPCDQKAIDYYCEYKILRDKAVKEYTENFGPITNEYVCVDNYWTWTQGPWPWEGEC